MAKNKKNKKVVEPTIIKEPVFIEVQRVEVYPQVFTVGGMPYLGHRNAKGVIGIRLVSDGGSMSSETFAGYMKAEQLGETIQLEVGAASDIITRDLKPTEVLTYNHLKAVFAEAERSAKAVTINNIFDTLRGKI